MKFSEKGAFSDKGPYSKGEGSRLDRNIEFNRERWGKRELWEEFDDYGYNWSSMHEVTKYCSPPMLATQYLSPYLSNRYDLKILEIAPGAGRFTTELVRVSEKLYLVDLNEACIELCRERFKWYRNISYFVNDGISLPDIGDEKIDMLASWDSLVHVEPEIIHGYLAQAREILVPDGLAWIHHSAHGVDPRGRRSSMTDNQMKSFANDLGYSVEAMYYFGETDCLSVLKLPAAT